MFLGILLLRKNSSTDIRRQLGSLITKVENSLAMNILYTEKSDFTVCKLKIKGQMLKSLRM